MANYSFGDCDEIVCQHSTGEYRFKPKSNEDSTVDPGGIRANDDANQITSDGILMSQLNRVRGSVEQPVAVNNNLFELNNASLLAGHPDLGTWTFSYLNGIILKGKGRPVADLQYASNAGTMTLKVALERAEVLNVT